MFLDRNIIVYLIHCHHCKGTFSGVLRWIMANKDYKAALLGDLTKLESDAQASTILSVSDVPDYLVQAAVNVELQIWLSTSAVCDILITVVIIFLVLSLPRFPILS